MKRKDIETMLKALEEKLMQLTKTEDKTEFKVGDKVKIKKSKFDSFAWLYEKIKDEIFTIYKISDKTVFINNDKYILPFMCDKDEIELYVEPKKITLKEFWESKDKLAIHCDTKEKATILLKAFSGIGKKWISGDDYTRYTYWRVNKDKTCYTNNNHFSNPKTCKEQDFIIYEFKNVILPEEPKWTFTEDEKVILRNLPAEYKWIVRDEIYDKLYIFEAKPYKLDIKNIWVVNMAGKVESISEFNHLFQSIQWEDDEPCEFREYL